MKPKGIGENNGIILAFLLSIATLVVLSKEFILSFSASAQFPGRFLSCLLNGLTYGLWAISENYLFDIKKMYKCFESLVLRPPIFLIIQQAQERN